MTAVSNPESNCVANARQLYTSARPIDDGGSYKNRSSTGCRTLLRKLQSVQNATARLITGTRRSDHISPVLRELHWLPSRERLKSKVECLVRQSFSGQAPLHLAADDCRLLSDSTRRSLRSADVSTCVVPRTLSSYGDRTFAAARTLFQSSCVILTSPMDCSDDS